MDPVKTVTQGIHVASRHNEPSHAVVDKIWTGAVGRRYYRKAASHSLDDVAAEPIQDRWEHVNVAAGHDFCELRSWYVP